MSASYKHHFELLAACMIYGTVGIFMELLRDMSVGSIIFYRLLFGLAAILCYLAVTGKLGQLSLKKRKKYLLLLGLLYVSQMFSYYSAIRYLGASSAVLLLYTDPIYLTFLAPLLLGEKNTGRTILALFLGLIGVFYVTRPEGGFEQLDFTGDYLKGVLFGLTGGLFSSGVIVSVRYLRNEYNGLTQLFWQSTISLVFLAPLAASVPGDVLAANLRTLMLFGVMITAIGAVLYIRGVAGVTAVTGSILTLVEPVSCIFFDYTVLNNSVHSGMLVGSVFILAAAIVVSLDSSVSLKKLISGERKIFGKKGLFGTEEE
ncbi:DMT family transporter [Methanosarcina sp. KYL-1]|uniref:DMT family transporter n=1 Tax=Methanosarcina sp. KYL-1 TaxID=2602068 RepID=UPI002100C8CB|nr:DMT family transporter [Methanosarcina sp. KYL-1]MCQ1535784.1 DMT family transporter [Methanosarcina sp. KYL-1]